MLNNQLLLKRPRASLLVDLMHFPKTGKVQAAINTRLARPLGEFGHKAPIKKNNTPNVVGAI